MPVDGLPNVSSEHAPQPRLAQRERFVVGCVLVVFAILAGRLLQIQVFERDEFSHRAQKQQTLTLVIPARPGDIVDRSGRLLATTTLAPSLYVDPSEIEDPQEVAAALSGVLGLDDASLAKQLSESSDRRFLWIARRLTSAQADAVRALDLPPVAWGFRAEFRRRYPQGVLAAHALGLRDIDGVGRGGVEQFFDNDLHGVDGRRRIVRDARGEVLEVLEEVAVEPQDGRTIRLTLDSVIQSHVEQRLDRLMAEMQPLHVSAVVLEPGTGEILAMAARPAFDPNQPETASEEAWLNPVIAWSCEPGSTIKPLIVAWAVDTGMLDPQETFDCEWGEYRMGGRTLHDHHRYGVLDVEEILVRSSNIGMAKIGERLTNAELHRAVQAFGFGRKTGIELPGELAGTLRPLSQWNGYSTGSVPMGQEIAATPLQIIAAHATLANGGRRVTPHLLLESDNRAASHVVTSQVVAPATANWIVESPLVGVIERGTGRRAQIEGVSVFGKSGTAQKFDPETGRYSHTRHVSSFLCGAPAERPQALVLVTIDEPSGPVAEHYGGAAAAPAAADILQMTLRYQHTDARMTESATGNPPR